MDVNRKGLAQGPVPDLGGARTAHARHRPHARHARGPAPARGLLRLHPRQAAPRRRDRAGRSRPAPGHANLGQPRGADRRARESVSPRRRTSQAICSPSWSWRGGSTARPARKVGPGPRGSTTTQFVVGAVGEKDQEVLRLVARLEGQRCCITRTSARSSRWWEHRSRASRPRRRRASLASTRPSTCCASTASASKSWRSRPVATCRSSTIPRRRGRWPTPNASPSR